MEPTYYEGEIVWVFNWAFLFREPKVGEVVAAKAEKKIFLKRVEDASREGYFLVGDNLSDSLDSRVLGRLRRKEIVGKVI